MESSCHPDREALTKVRAFFVSGQERTYDLLWSMRFEPKEARKPYSLTVLNGRAVRRTEMICFAVIPDLENYLSIYQFVKSIVLNIFENNIFLVYFCATQNKGDIFFGV